MQIAEFLNQLAQWSASRPDIQALALAGSHARGQATPESDIDLVLLTTDPARYLEQTGWAGEFGTVQEEQIEDYGRLTSLRIWYLDGREVEYGIAPPDWAARPLDDGTREVLQDGLQVLFERRALLSSLVEENEPQRHEGHEDSGMGIREP
jgi:predicted nucleotidyltransferase